MHPAVPIACDPVNVKGGEVAEQRRTGPTDGEFSPRVFNDGVMVVKEMTPGVSGEVTTEVTADMLASKWGSGAVEVLSTPVLVGLMEAAALKAVECFLEDGETTVGSLVNVSHLAPTPPGLKVVAKATLADVSDRKMVFKVEAWDDVEKIGEGTHERYLVDSARFVSRARKKIFPSGDQSTRNPQG